MTKLDQKFKSNCFFYYSGNVGSITINVLLACCKKCQPFQNFFFLNPSGLSLNKHFQWYVAQQKPAICIRRMLHQHKLLTSHLKPMVYLGLQGNANTQEQPMLFEWAPQAILTAGSSAHTASHLTFITTLRGGWNEPHSTEKQTQVQRSFIIGQDQTDAQ